MPENWWDSGVWRGPAFSWDVWTACNYRCTYCHIDLTPAWDLPQRSGKNITADDWLRAWDGVHRLMGTAKIDLLGGEPLFYPEAERLLSGICRLHKIALTSNLSLSLEELKRILERCPPESLHAAGSFHPEFTDPGPFFEKMLLLKERGYSPVAVLVAWPPIIPEVPKWRALFEEKKIPLNVTPFQGEYQSKHYPAAYNSVEKTLIAARSSWQFSLMDQTPTRGVLCGAGHIYANVRSNGDVYRCGRDVSGSFGRPLGSIFDPGFSLLPEPAPCPYDTCKCNESAYIWDNWQALQPK